MNKYLITGASGFVGKYFVEYLRKNEPFCEILGVDRNASLKNSNIDLNNICDVNAVICDFKPDYILHLASMSSVGQSWQEPGVCLKNNLNIMLNLLEVVRINNLKSRILAVGSSEEYGDGIIPFKEDMPLHPKNPYAIAKVWQEMACSLYAKNFGVDVVMTRSFNHIGPGQSDRFVIPSFVKQLVAISDGVENKLHVGNIDVERDFTDVRDVVDAYYKLLHNGKNGEVYNVCSGQAYKLKDIISVAENILKIKANVVVDENLLRPNDVMCIRGNNSKLCGLGWKVSFNLRQTVEDIIKGMK